MDYVTEFRKSCSDVEMFAARKEVFKANYLKMDDHGVLFHAASPVRSSRSQ